ncbi:MAG: uracil-DNA glycosylase [Candidatus Eremiobacter antarcticus]|nr:uracil-DNA glycosylase [Candidatus Eremiobacteraeota bacterium]MBC5808956.1 uracil-DNA glycosylase [Candidatus Eremiobacteraeota bacterium]PZR60364.1 MAG: uracil-DNA glycosylase [Candidatus Eremiobacter sp. RRmetagenome_bin22]
MDSDTFSAIQRSVVRCARCPELRAYCASIARERKREFASDVYWGKPVPPFGDPHARLLIVGLAPAAHGGNRTGRMFTGDGSANWLARALHPVGFATQPYSGRRDDGYSLVDCYMTAVLRCAPPGNRPTPRQISNCSVHLERELNALSEVRVVVALGQIAFDVIVRQLQRRGYGLHDSRAKPKFGHDLQYELQAAAGPRLVLLSSYHPSRQNTNTGKLSQEMLNAVFERARRLLDQESRGLPAFAAAPL